MRTVWIVNCYWSIDGYTDSQISAFEEKEDAVRFFKRQIKDIKTDFYCAFDKNGALSSNYEMEEEDNYFEIWKSQYYCSEHSGVKMFELEVTPKFKISIV